MKLLLDTHIWIWSFLEPTRIARRVAAALEDAAVEKWLSPISIWECMILVKKGRLELMTDSSEWINRALREFPLTEAPFTTEVALAVPTIGLRHHDPADSFLAATAKVFDLTLVTADSRLLSAKGISVLPNR